MRVLATTPNYLPSRVGAWLATHRLLVRLVQRGHQVTVFTWQRREPPRMLDGIRVVSGLQGKSHALAMARDVDVVVSHFGDGGFGAEVARATGRRSVRLAHGGGPHGPEGCDLAVFNAHSLRESWGWDGPSIVVHPYVDPAEHATTPGDRVTLVNLSELKGGRLFDRLARSMPHVGFLGVRGGYGTQVNVRHPNVDLLAPTEDMRGDVYARTRILLMPSEYETWGMVGVEAMCSGIPVIAHPTAGLLESLGAAGIFVDRDDPAGWVTAIERLGEPVEYELAAKRARARVDELTPEMASGPDRFVDAVEGLV